MTMKPVVSRGVATSVTRANVMIHHTLYLIRTNSLVSHWRLDGVKPAQPEPCDTTSPLSSTAEDEYPASQLAPGAILPPCCAPSKVAAPGRKIHRVSVSPRLFESGPNSSFSGDDCGRRAVGAVSQMVVR